LPKLAAITIYADDLNEAKELYCDKLGFDIAYTIEDMISLKNEE